MVNSLQTVWQTEGPEPGPIAISNNGASIVGEPSENQIEEAMGQLAVVGRACQFVIGDLINHAAGKWGEKYARWMEVTGLEYQTLRTYAHVCRSIPLERRRPALSFSHHQEVASLSTDAQERRMNEAESLSMSKKRLRRSIQLGRPAMPEDFQAAAPAASIETNAPQANEPASAETIHPHVNRLCVILGKMESAGSLERMSLDQLVSLHRDFLGAFRAYRRIFKAIFLRAASAPVRMRVMQEVGRAAFGTVPAN